uniref:Prostaglandin E receptor 4 n=1 Tax=Malurus cyaneus samueli TaxID=2593467 RepID=A0A8C5TQA1_9PASS
MTTRVSIGVSVLVVYAISSGSELKPHGALLDFTPTSYWSIALSCTACGDISYYKTQTSVPKLTLYTYKNFSDIKAKCITTLLFVSLIILLPFCFRCGARSKPRGSNSFILLFFGLSGLSIICAMSIERYLAINHAYFYNHYVDKKLAGLTLFAIYASNVLFCALPSMGLGRSTLQYPRTWCFIDWRTNISTHAAYSYMYAGFSSFLILVTVICNILVCVALIRMHRQFMRRTSLGTDTTSSRLSDFRRRRSFRRMAGAEIQMVILLIATSLVVVICSIPLVSGLREQLYRPAQCKPDLQAIRIASVNPSWTPGSTSSSARLCSAKPSRRSNASLPHRRGSEQHIGGNFKLRGWRRTLLAMSSQSPSFISRELREIKPSTSQTLLYPPELSESSVGGRALLPGPSASSAQSDTTSVRTLRSSDTSDSSQGQDSESVSLVNEIRSGGRASSASKSGPLQVTFPTETLNLSEKCI